jgi:dethiobiotin synthetase
VIDKQPRVTHHSSITVLQPSPIPGLLITGTDTGIGKTLIAGAIAAYARKVGLRVGVLKPAASGCVRRREGLVSEDAEFLAHCADARQPLDIIAPQRFAEPLAPAIATQRLDVSLDWEAIQRSMSMIARESDVLVVEGVGGIMVPMDAKHTMLDVARWLKLPAVVVARPNLGTINHTLLTINALRGAKVKVAGVVVNRYPAELPGVAEETNPRAIEKWGKVPVLAIVPEVKEPIGLRIPEDIEAAIANVDWRGLMEPAR